MFKFALAVMSILGACAALEMKADTGSRACPPGMEAVYDAGYGSWVCVPIVRNPDGGGA